MKHAYLALALLAAGLAAGCANPGRSRDLANPKVPAVVLAQQVCSNCHGIAGTSVSPNFPNLAAQTPAYIVGQLKEFKSHGRADPPGFEYMWGLSRSLTDEQIAGLAAYFSSQMPAHQPVEADPSLAAAGKAIFKGGLPSKNVPACASCHGDAGQGHDAFPRLASQHVDYIVKQLIVFQRTDERPKGAVMKTIVHDLSADDIRKVAAYLQTLG
ncbi:MAG: c-type cytochrome [Ramlibacter sp.]